MNIFMLCNFLKTLPRDLDEAAFIDGCGYFRYVFTIAMPLMLPIVVTLVMLKVIGCWNDFLNPYIYVTDPAYRTLSTGLYLFMGQYASQWQLYTAAVFIVAAANGYIVFILPKVHYRRYDFRRGERLNDFGGGDGITSRRLIG